jgi:hypothetical protein
MNSQESDRVGRAETRIKSIDTNTREKEER